MGKIGFLAGLFGFPLAVPLVMIGWMTPRYVPSAAMTRAASSSPDPLIARQRILDSLTDRCRYQWKLGGDRLERPARLFSWENDRGLLARTEIDCTSGQCKVHASALIRLPERAELGGKPIPTRMWSCRFGRSFPYAGSPPDPALRR